MDNSGSSSSNYGEPPSARAAADLGRAPAELPELLEDAMPHVQAALRELLAIADITGGHITQQQHQRFQELAEVQMSFGGDGLLNYLRNAGQILQQTVFLGDLIELPEVTRAAVAARLLRPAPARAALLKLLAAMLRWEPGAQLPAASFQHHQQQQQQPSLDVDAGCSSGEREGQGKVAEQTQGADDVGLVEQEEGLALSDLRNDTSVLVSKLLDCARKSLGSTYDVHRALLSLEFGCSLLQTRVLQCLSRQLAAASAGLVEQLPPETAAAQQDQQQRQYEEAPAPPFAGLQSAQIYHSAATTSGGGLHAAHMARRTLGMASVLLSGLHGLLVTAADAYHWCGAAGNTAGPQHSGRPAPGPLQQQPHPEDVTKTLRQLSRRYLLLLAGGLRDSHVLDHWARAVLLAGLCREAGERGWEEEGREEEEEGTGEVVSRAADEGRPSQGGEQEQQQQQQELPVTLKKLPGGQGEWRLHLPSAPHAQHVWTCLGAISRVLAHCNVAREAGSSEPLGSLPPALDTALRQALSGPCTQHLTLALGTLMLHQADGGSLYGMPLPYRTGALAAAVGKACRRLSPSQHGAAPQEGLQLIDQELYLYLSSLLSRTTSGVPQPPPAVPPEGHLDLLLRLGRLAVRSAQAHRGQEGGTGPQGGLVMNKADTGGVAMAALWVAHALLSSRGQGALAGAGGSVGTVEGPGGGLGETAGGGAVGAAAGRGESVVWAKGGRGLDRGGAAAEGQAGTGQLGTPEAVAWMLGQPGRSTESAAGAARRAARAAVAAETRWHRLLMDTGLWVEMEGEELGKWVKQWNTVCKQRGQMPKDAGGRSGGPRQSTLHRILYSCQP